MSDAVFDVQAAKEQFSWLLARAESGERIVITRDGRPVAMLTAVGADPPGKRMSGQEPTVIAHDFDAPLPEFDSR